MKKLAILFYVLMTASVLKGFHKLFVYESPDGFGDAVNAYVGGDAYNYIINAGQAAAYFVLGVLCAVIAMTCLLLDKKEQKQVNNENHLESQQNNMK